MADILEIKEKITSRAQDVTPPDEIASIASLQEGESGWLCPLPVEHPLYGQLTDLGWDEGIRISCVRYSPAGDPVAYRVRGVTVALRRGDIAALSVRKEIECPSDETGG